MLFKSLQSISNIQSTSSKAKLNTNNTITATGTNSVQLLDLDACVVVDLLPLLFVHADVSAHI